VEQSLSDRRSEPRFLPPLLHAVRATLRPGCAVVIVNLSAWGALLEAGRPLRPGARVHLQLVTQVRTVVLAAHVLRCTVWVIDHHAGPTYRGALRFEQRCDPFR
jgi:PilZ domain-containing protein